MVHRFSRKFVFDRKLGIFGQTIIVTLYKMSFQMRLTAKRKMSTHLAYLTLMYLEQINVCQSPQGIRDYNYSSKPFTYIIMIFPYYVQIIPYKFI